MNDPNQLRASTEEKVRVCESCGHVNPADESPRCNRCWLPLTWVTAVGQVEAEQLVRVRRKGLLRRRLMVRAVPLALVVGLGIWTLSAFIHLGPKPASATTTISADLGTGTWAQARRTPQNTGFTPDQA